MSSSLARIPRISLLSIALLALLTVSPTAARADRAGSGADEQRTKLEALRTRISGLRAEMQSKSGEKNELSRLLQDAEKQIGRLASKLRVIDGRLSRQRELLQGLETEKTTQRQALEQQRHVLARQVRAAYAMGRQERVKILLNQQDPATVSRVMVYYDYLNRVRVQKMEAIRGHIQRLAATELEIRDEEHELASLLEEQQAEIMAMKLSQDQRRDLVARLTRELNDQGQQLDRLQTDERDLRTLISGLEEALADIPAEHPQQVKFAGRRGRLPWPARGRIVNGFGAPKLGNLVWDGVMISAPEGREVRAIHHGRVAFADWLRGFGLLLIVDHGDGYMTLYGHNQSLFKEAGDWVQVNEPVALVGSSGGREQAGVYFGIRHKGRAVNPARWCRRPTGGKVG